MPTSRKCEGIEMVGPIMKKSKPRHKLCNKSDIGSNDVNITSLEIGYV
jgi:hypothetical protein